MNRSLLLVLLFTLALRVAFLNQAIQGDDVYYLAGAQHALIDPLHPHHARYAFGGEMVDMRGHPHPPLNTWMLAGLLAVFGDVYEVPFHAVYTLFSLLAIGAVWWLARRFGAPPGITALMVAVVPAFVISGTSLEADLPFLAFLMCGVALFICGSDNETNPILALAAVSLALAAMTAYQAILFTPILALYRRRWRNWVVASVPVLTIAAWQIFERVTSGSVPLEVLHGYTREYGFEAVKVKLASAAALTVHLGWLVFPVVAVVAFLPKRRAVLAAIVAVSALLAFHDASPLFWASFGVGLMVVAGCVARLRSDEWFLAVWVLIFFGASLVGAYAGAERYLLPIAAPVAILAARALANRRGWLIAAFACQCAVSLALAAMNYQHWGAYRAFVAAHASEIETHRTWVSAEWGLRFYAESEGALPLLNSTRIQPGDLVLTSALAGHARDNLVTIAEQDVLPAIPLRIIGLQTRSGFSSSGFGQREFDISTSPLDVIRLQKLVEHEPTVSWLPMDSPAAAYQIVSGAYPLENNWRWVGASSTFRVLTAGERRVAADFFVPAQAVPCTVTLAVNGETVATASYTTSAKVQLVGVVQGTLQDAVSVTLTTTRTFRAPGDARDLGLVLSAIGFEPASPGTPPVPRR